MSDTPSRKTLSLKPRSTSRDSTTPERKDRPRAGARARQAALRQHAQQANPSATDAAPRSEARKRPQGPHTEQQHPHAAPRRPPRDAQRESPSSRAAEQVVAESLSEAPSEPRIQRKPRTPRAPRITETFTVFAPCPHGLEEALSLELQALGYESVQAGRAGCHFQADWTSILRANLYSRLATRILVQVAHADVHTEDDILELARQTPWERWFGAEQTLRVDTSAIRSPMQSLQYCNLRTKDGICDRLRELEGARPDIDTVRPDARVHLFLDAHSATLYLDVSGESLFKRGWRLDKGEAPLRENLAAGMLALSDWTPDSPLLDPFCGSGTILIEAAWIALGVPPGIWRPFGFERLRSHDARLWRDLKDDARARIATRLEQPIVGCDLQPAAIAAARSNVERAHLGPEAIRFEVCDARALPAPGDAGWIVTNPPYGERLSEEDSDLWSQWATHLKRHYGGWRLNVITSDLDFPKRLRLKARRRYPLYNGDLDCRLFQFELVSAGYRDPADGASEASGSQESD